MFSADLSRPRTAGRAAVRGFLAAVLAIALGSCTAVPAAGPDDETPVALVYRGPASCEGCPEAAAQLLRASDDGFDVVFVGPDESLEVTPRALAEADVYVQPGGDGTVEDAYAALGPRAPGAIREFVRGGGRYLGLCMGAYLAGSDPGMDLLAPGDAGGYIDQPGARVSTAEDAVVPVLWGGERRMQFAQDPAFILPSGEDGEIILSTFDNGLVNALVRPYGEGMVAVVGTHPEADRSWYSEDLWAQDTDGVDRDAAMQLVEAMMRGS